MSENVELRERVREFVLGEFKPDFGRPADRFDTNPLWARMEELGTRLWLDTGSMEESESLWTREFSALTTNNTLLNREVQRGQYDGLVKDAAALLAEFNLSEQERMLEIAFILNARHGLRLVEKYDALVSVEEHTDLAHDLDRAKLYARRYHEICPERFIVKIPFTPAGLLATRAVAEEGIPVNHTLGFSARQNYLIAAVGKPSYVNVFLGRLNSFVADNGLGDGTYVGEKATLGSQALIRELRAAKGLPTMQIGASLRSGEQIRDLAGLDVLTMPPKAAQQFLELGLSPDALQESTTRDYKPGLADSETAAKSGLDVLWSRDERLVQCVAALEQEDLGAMGPDALVAFFAEHGCADVLVAWSETQRATSAEEGKIPKLENWREPLENHTVGLDSLMNLAGLNAFIADQAAMDARVAGVLVEGGQ